MPTAIFSSLTIKAIGLAAARSTMSRPGKFHGHPASLVWQEGEMREPQKIPLAELDASRTRPSVVFPQDLMANSPAQPLLDATGGKFGHSPVNSCSAR
jgi:hypothetical protein